jgi:hypothetical protein
MDPFIELHGGHVELHAGRIELHGCVIELDGSRNATKSIMIASDSGALGAQSSS